MSQRLLAVMAATLVGGLAACAHPQRAPASSAGQPAVTATSDNPGNEAVRTVLGQPIEPFRIAGNIYYVGAANIASYLIATSSGLILLDTGTREMVPHVQASIAKLGFRIGDVKILLNGHAHWDHVEGHAAMKRATGAQVMEMAEDAAALSSGRDPLSDADDPSWEPVAVDRILHDGDDVVLGDVTMHAVLTAGHTPGCTSWTTTTKDAARSYAVVFICVPAAAKGVPLVGNKLQPTIADDLARSLRVLGALTPDIYLDGHPQDIYGPRLARLRAGEVPSPLVDPAGYRSYLAECQADLDQRLQRERAGH
jgi:metallo-beta-lactamase class B